MLEWDDPQLTLEQIAERFREIFGREMLPEEQRSLLLGAVPRNEEDEN